MEEERGWAVRSGWKGFEEAKCHLLTMVPTQESAGYVRPGLTS